MRRRTLETIFLFISLVFAVLVACSGENKTAGGVTEDEGIVAIVDKAVDGVSQKGPYVKGSQVNLYELDGNLKPTGKVFPGEIFNDRGEFSLTRINLESQFVHLVSKGYYRNEISGKTSVGEITLNAISNILDRKTVNINLLTHLEYPRVLSLISNGMSLSEAKSQAESEVFSSFYIDDGEQRNFEDLNIFKNSDEDAALLAVSVLLQRELSEGDLTAELKEISDEIAEKGAWSDNSAKAKIADWAESADLESIRANIEKWDFGAVPEFERYVKRFWWFAYGLGVCDAEKEGSVAKVKNDLSENYNRQFLCVQGNWASYWLWDAANGNKILMEDFNPSSKEIGRVQAWTDKTDGASTTFYLGTSATDFASALQVVEDFSSHDAVFVRDDVIKDCGGVCGTVVFGEAIRKSNGFRYDSNPWVAVRLNSVMDANQGVNALHWGGMCIEYESSHELNIYTYSRKPFDNIDDNRLLAVVPASEKKTVVNLPWERFSPMPWLAENIPIQNFLKNVSFVIIMVFGQPSETANFNITKVGSLGTCE